MLNKFIAIIIREDKLKELLIDMNNRLLIIFSLLVISLHLGCGEIKEKEEHDGKYSISLGEFSSFDEADLFKSKVDFQLWNELKIVKLDENKFELLYGNFVNSFEAGEKGFNLYKKSIISNYKIFHDNNFVFDNFSNFLFIANYQARPSIFKFNMLKEESRMFWSRWGRKVIALNPSHDKNTAFITTALGYGQQAKFPYVRDARLYLFNAASDQIDELMEFGYVLQIYTYWENPDTFKINITEPDSIKSEVMIQKIYSFHKSGSKGNVVTRSFNLVKDGFPKAPAIRPTFVSSDKRFQVREERSGDNNSIIMKDFKTQNELLVATTRGSIFNTGWSNDNKYLFVILENTLSSQKTNRNELILVNTEEKKIMEKFIGPEFKNLFVQGNFLFFDDKSEGYEQIKAYNLVEKNIEYRIILPGGCRLN